MSSLEPATIDNTTGSTIDGSLNRSFEQVDMWTRINSTTNYNNYPRPQGSLPMFTWGLKKNEQIKMNTLYNSAGNNSQ